VNVGATTDVRAGGPTEAPVSLVEDVPDLGPSGVRGGMSVGPGEASQVGDAQRGGGKVVRALGRVLRLRYHIVMDCKGCMECMECMEYMECMECME